MADTNTKDKLIGLLKEFRSQIGQKYLETEDDVISALRFYIKYQAFDLEATYREKRVLEDELLRILDDNEDL